MNIFRLRLPWLLALAVLLTGASFARAGYITETVQLNQSNLLKDGVNYGSVLIEANNGASTVNGLGAGDVRLTYLANPAVYASTNKGFGIDDVAFNTNLALSAAQITGPSGWKVKPNGTQAGFGNFSWDILGNASGGTRPNPVSILITGLGSNATLDNFLIGSTGNGKDPPPAGSVFFAMHVAGFGVTPGKDIGADLSNLVGQIAGGSTVTSPPSGSGEVPVAPEPASLALAGLGLGVLSLVQGVRKYRRR